METVAGTSDRNDAQLCLFREFKEESPVAEIKDEETVEEPDITLADGMPLPKYLRDKFPDHLFGKPIFEIDPFYVNKNTFVVISTNWVIHRFSSLKSLWMLSPLNRLRWLCIRIMTHCIYRSFMLIFILIYAAFFYVTYSLHYHLPILIVFALEMNVKIIARGLVLHPFSYLRDSWNWIDFVLNHLGFSLGNFVSYLAPFHSLRTLRLIHFFTYSRLTYSWTFQSLYRMKDLLIYGAYIFVLFTLYAQMKFEGHFQNRCVKEILSPYHPHVSSWIMINPNVSACGNATGARACPEGFYCMAYAGQNPNAGYTSFDTFAMSALSITRLMAKDYWENLFMFVHATIGAWDLPFFLTVIVYGNYYYINFIVANLATGMTELLHILEGKKPKRKRKNIHSDKTPLDTDDNLAASEKEINSTKIDEKDSIQAMEAPLIDQETDQLNKQEAEGDVIVLEMVVSDDQNHGDENIGKQEDTERPESPIVVTHRRNPIVNLFLAFVDAFCDWNCCPCWVTFQRKLSVVVLSRYFNIFIGICIVLNVIIMALDHHNMTLELYLVLLYSNSAFTLVYFIEATMKILALSPKHYFKDWHNVFDFTIVVFCIVEMALENIQGLSVLRLFRVFRILRLERWWPPLQSFLNITKTNAWALFTIVIMFALMGYGLFLEDYHWISPENLSRWNFSTEMSSILVIVRILCGEWVEPLWDCMLVSSPWMCMPFFFAVIIVGNLVIFTLFVTMVMTAIHSYNLCETHLEERTLATIIKNFFTSTCPALFKRSNQLGEKISGKSQEELFDTTIEGEARLSQRVPLAATGEDVVSPCCCDICYKFLPWCGSPSSGPSSFTAVTAEHTPFWSRWGNLRSQALCLVRAKYFDPVMIVLIILTAIPVFWDDAYTHEHEVLYGIFIASNYLVAFIYSIEVVLQIMGQGCKKYLTDGWYCFDFQITLMHLGALFLSTWNVHMKLAMGLRLLKLIPRVKRLKVIISAIFYKIAIILDILLASSFIWLFFAIVGVQLFGGKYYKCVDSNFETLPATEVVGRIQCIEDHNWINANANFDNVGEAFVALFHVATFKGWIVVVQDAIDSHAIDLQPIRDSFMHATWYFVAFLILGVLCCFAFIVANFIKKVNDHKKQIIGGYIEILMTEEQRKTFAKKKGNFFIYPEKAHQCPDSLIRKLVFRLIVSSQFKLSIIVCTVLNAIGLATITLKSDEIMHLAVGYIDLSFFLVFAIEVILRIIAFWSTYFKRAWNIYDFVLFIFSLLSYTLHPFFPQYTIYPLLFGILRIVRLVRWLKWVRRITSKIWLYNIALTNVSHLLFVIICTYAVIGVQYYRDLPIIGEDNDLQNFKSFFPAMIAMSMMGFAHGWGDVVDAHGGIYTFILSYLFIFYLIIIQVGTILLLEYYFYLNEKRRLGITEDALENYVEAWKILDPDATGYIAYDHLSEFLNTLLPPFQIPHPNADRIAALDIPVYKENNVSFNDILSILMSELDEDGKISRPAPQNLSDLISSTQKMQQSASAKCTETELNED